MSEDYEHGVEVYGPSTGKGTPSVTLFECQTCAALVKDMVSHDVWHSQFRYLLKDL